MTTLLFKPDLATSYEHRYPDVPRATVVPALLVSPDKSLIAICRARNKAWIQQAFLAGADPTQAFHHAGAIADFQLYSWLVSVCGKTQDNYQNMILGTCRAGHLDFLRHNTDYAVDNYNFALLGACQMNHQHIIRWLITMPERPVDWDYGLWGACQGGHMSLVRLAVDNKAQAFDHGLYRACLGGHRHIADYMIECGATVWNEGLAGACRGGHSDFIEWMISLGADKCDTCKGARHKFAGRCAVQ